MACYDYSDDSLILPQLIDVPQLDASLSFPFSYPEQRCAVCEKINFAYLVDVGKEFCPGCEISNHHASRGHYHLGTVGLILQKKFCPGCSLIASVLSKVMFGMSTDTVRVALYPAWMVHRLKPERDSRDRVTAQRHLGKKILRVILQGPNIRGNVGAGFILMAGLSTVSKTLTTTATAKAEPSTEVLGVGILEKADIHQFKRWIQICADEHPNCRPGPSLQKERISTSQSFRLVDVQENCIIKSYLTEDYVALSYVWGSASPLLTRMTKERFSESGGLNGVDIPSTIGDAMHLVRDLGMRYLWVDSLCIVQDDFADKQRQLPIMDKIYSSASLVVIAATGSDAAAGLPGFGQTKRPATHLAKTLDGVDLLACPAEVDDAVSLRKWRTRGWTFQELYCARRVLVVTEGVVHWCCQAVSWREDLIPAHSDATHWDSSERSIWGGRDLARLTCRTMFFCSQVQDFASRSFKDKSDSLWAIAGVLKHMGLRFPRGFVWAHPYERLDATLLWRKKTSCLNTHQLTIPKSGLRMGEGQHHLLCPSWSWLSVEEDVVFPDPCGSLTLSQVVWHDPFLLGGEGTPNEYIKAMFSGKEKDKIEIERALKMARNFPNLDFGLLHFTCHMAHLNIRRKRSPKEGGFGKVEEDYDDSFISVGEVYSPQKECILKLLVPSYFFQGHQERIGELILLSSGTEEVTDEVCQSDDEVTGLDCGSIRHVSGCKHIKSHNLMLIERRGGIAYRVDIGEMERRHWDGLETREETIVLG